MCSMSVSPGGNQLATIEVSGRLSVWELPSFRLKKSWTLQEQVLLYIVVCVTNYRNTRSISLQVDYIL